MVIYMMSSNILLVDHGAEPLNYRIKKIALIFGYITHYGNMFNRNGVSSWTWETLYTAYANRAQEALCGAYPASVSHSGPAGEGEGVEGGMWGVRRLRVVLGIGRCWRRRVG